MLFEMAPKNGGVTARHVVVDGTRQCGPQRSGADNTRGEIGHSTATACHPEAI